MNHGYRFGFAFAVAAFGAGILVLAQGQPDLSAIASGIKQNQLALRDYAWESRVSVAIDGEQKKVDLFQVRYDLDGKLQRTRVGGEADEKKVRGPIRKHKVKDKKEEIQEFTAELKAKLASYMSPESMATMAEKAFAKQEQGSLMLLAQDVVQPGDSVQLEMVEQTRQPMTLTVETAVEDSPVILSVTFQKLGDGPNYPARTTIDTSLDKKKLTVVTENFSYVKQGG